MTYLSKAEIQQIFDAQKSYFFSQETLDIEFRKQQLKKLRQAVLDHSEDIFTALEIDLGKPREMVQIAEIDSVVDEIDIMLANIDEWIKDVSVPTPESFGPADSLVRREAFGVNYIISPFNYPFNLTFAPLIGAIAGGNTAIIKPAENTPESSKIIKKIVDAAFAPEYICVVEGGLEENKILLDLPFDFIFFTGSPRVGSIVMQAAAKNLTPVALELGGKSPFIILEDADLDKAVESLGFGKFINCGQTCVAPDYVYVHKNVKDALVAKLKTYLSTNFGEEYKKLGKLVSQQQVQKLAQNIEATPDKIAYGGRYDVENRHFEPTLIDDAKWHDPIMQEEIFGPIVPIVTFENVAEISHNVNKYHPKPLAAYVFSKDEKVGQDLINAIPSGDAELNGSFMHVLSPYLPFGGVGTSGLGSYHGKYSIETFTHPKSLIIYR